MLEKYQLGVFERFFIKWQTRSLGNKLDKMILILPVIVCVGANENLDKTIQNLKKFLSCHIRSRRIKAMVFKRIMFKVKRYLDNQELLYDAKQKVCEMITQNIQIFSLVLDILDGLDRELGRMSMIVKKNYEENYEINAETKRLLEYQERRHFADEIEID